MRIQSRLGEGAVVASMLLVSLASAAGGRNDSREPEPLQQTTLSHTRPQATFRLDEQRAKKGETTIVLRLVWAENPDRTDFTVAVLLAPCHAAAESRTVPVGALGVYPAGEIGGSYALDLIPALKQMQSAGYETRQICLRLQLKPLRPSADWKRLRVTVTNPEWKEPPSGAGRGTSH